MPEIVDSNYSGVYKRAKELYNNKRYKEAVKMLEAVVENDISNYKACFFLAECLFEGKGTIIDFKRAFDLYFIAAQNKEIEAAYKLGLCYLDGLGTRQDYTQAVAWFTEAAKYSHTMSQYYLGLAYMEGKGITKDIPIAIQWLVHAAKEGIVDAQKNAGICLKMLNHHREAATLFLAAARNGDVYSMECIADYYENGEHINKCDELANKFYEEAANKNNHIAQNKLAYRYYEGKGIEKSVNKAVYWWMKAASGDVVDAQNRLGLCYYNGDGVQRDSNQAVIWWKKAANAGNVDSMINLAEGYLDDSLKFGGDANESKYWWTKAAETGNSYAMYKLGVCFEHAVGIATPNIPEAYRWYKLSADNGYEPAKIELKNFKLVKGKMKKIN